MFDVRVQLERIRVKRGVDLPVRAQCARAGAR